MFEYVHLKYFCCHVALLFLLIATTKESAGAPQLGTPADDYTRHSVVQPVVHYGRSKREITSTRDTAGEHHKQVTVTVNVDGEEYVLDLSLNEQLVSKDHVISYQENGKTVIHKPTKEELDICQYSGTVRGKPGSWVAVSTCRGISGVIYDGHSMKYIEPAGEEGVNGQHFLYDHADLKTTPEYDEINDPENNVTSTPLLKRHPSEQILDLGSSRFKRQVYNHEKRYVELALVADNALFNNKGQSVDNVNRYLMDITNVVNSMFAPLNIDIILVRVVVWKERDEIFINNDIVATRDNFAYYRKIKLVTEFVSDFADLISHRVFSNGIGSVYQSEVCTNDKAVGVSAVFTSEIGRMASLVSRQVGRSIGMMVNGPYCDCRGPHCILYNVIVKSGPTQNQWSNCNRNELAAAYASNRDYCLRNVPQPTCGDVQMLNAKRCECGQNPTPECAEYCSKHCKLISSSISNLRSLIDTFKTTIPDITQLTEVLNLYTQQSDITMKICVESAWKLYVY